MNGNDLNTVTFPIAKALKEKGYAAGSESHYFVYQDDFLYDGDVSHPESHKKGEVRRYDFYSHNKYNSNNSYENPYIINVIYWLFSKGIIFNIFINKNRQFSINIKKLADDYSIVDYKNFTIENATTLYEAYIAAIDESLNFI